MKKLLFALVACFALVTATAQTEEELKAQIAPKKDSIAAIQKRVDCLNKAKNLIECFIPVLLSHRHRDL